MVQFTLPKLINDIEDFYQQANQAYMESKAQQQGFSMPDDPEDPEEESPQGGGGDTGMYDEIVEMAHRVGDPGLSSELLLLAEMYKRALEMGAGYGSINKAVNNLINIYMEEEDDEAEGSGVEDLLNEVVRDLRNRAGGPAMLAKPDAPAIVEKLRQLKEAFNSQSLQEEVDELTNYQQDDADIATETPEMTAARMGQMSKEEAGKGAGRGWHTVNTNRKDWAAGYENERLRYVDMLTEEKDPSVVSKLKNLVKVLGDLRDEVTIVNDLSSAFAAAPDTETEAKLALAREDMRKLRQARAVLKDSIRNYELSKNKSKAETELSRSRDPFEQFRLKQEAELYALMLSTDRGKTQERNWRRVLLKSISGGNKPSTDTLNKMLEKIQESSKQRVPQAVYRKEVAQKLKELKDKGEFEGLVIKLKQHLPNVKMGDKKAFLENERARLIQQAAAGERTTYKPYTDAIARAKTNNDKAGLKQAMSDLYNALSKVSDQFTQLKTQSDELEKNYADVTAWRRMLEQTSKAGVVRKEVVTDEELNMLRTLHRTGITLLQNAANYGLRPSTLELIRLINQSLFNNIKYQSAVQNRITNQAEPQKRVRVERIDPETGEVTYDEMDEAEALKLPQSPHTKILRGQMNKKQRKIALANIEKKALLDTSADAVVNQIMAGLEGIEDPNEYAHNAFQMMLEQIAAKMK